MSRTFIILIPTLLIIFIRFKPFDLLLRTFNTLVHECSHALVAVLFRQKVSRITLNRDFSGVCVTKINNKKAMFFISVAGYTLPAVIAYLMTRITAYNITNLTFYTIMSLSVFALIAVIGNSFGRLWTICFAGLNLIFALVPLFAPYYKHIIYIYACTLLVEDVISAITLLYITLTKPKKSGDAALLAKATHIPAIFWSLFFFCFAVFMSYVSITTVIGY